MSESGGSMSLPCSENEEFDETVIIPPPEIFQDEHRKVESRQSVKCFYADEFCGQKRPSSAKSFYSDGHIAKKRPSKLDRMTQIMTGMTQALEKMEC